MKKEIKIILIILLFILITFIGLKETNVINKIIDTQEKPEDTSFKISKQVTSIDENYIYLLVTVQDKENGIKQIITPDNLIINCNNKTDIALDYKIEVGKEYVFTAINSKEEKKVETVKYEYSSRGLLSDIEQINVSNSEQKINITQKSSTKIYDEMEYNVDTIVYNGDLTLDGVTEVEGSNLNNNVYEFGSSEDCGTNTEYATKTVLLKVNGNLTINEGITLTSTKNDSGYGGPKGMIIYCTGTITNNGTITMTARGAKAEGEEICLWANTDGTIEYIPKSGALGGTNAGNGRDGINRSTGGGGSGGNTWCASSSGSAGTSYSGGTGAGGAFNTNSKTPGIRKWWKRRKWNTS